MENILINLEAPDKAGLVITSVEDATFTIEYLAHTITNSLKRGQRYSLNFDSQKKDSHHRFSDKVENKSVYISSIGNLTDYVFNKDLN